MRLPLSTLTALVFLLGQARMSSADLIYDIQDYPAWQNGYTVNGTITTDGVLGTLTTADIVAWTVTISQGSLSETFSGTSADAALEAQVVATSSQVLIPNAAADAIANLMYLVGPGDSIVWDNSDGRTEYRAVVSGFSTLAWDTSPTSLGRDDNTWVVAQAAATVPELSSLHICLASLLSFAVYGCSFRSEPSGKNGPWLRNLPRLRA